MAALTEAERARLAAFKDFQDDKSGYLQIQGTRPLTVSHGLVDSPVAQPAWITEKFKDWTDPAAELPEDAVDRDRLLTNVSIYWFPGTALSSANSYYERFHDASAWAPKERSTVPTARRGLHHRRRDPALRREDRRHRPLDRVRPRRPLRGTRSARPTPRRPPRVHPLAEVIRAVWLLLSHEFRATAVPPAQREWRVSLVQASPRLSGYPRRRAVRACACPATVRAPPERGRGSAARSDPTPRSS